LRSSACVKAAGDRSTGFSRSLYIYAFSEAFYYKMKRLGLGPRELQWGRCVRITDQAEDEWVETRSADAVVKSPEAA